MLAKQILKEKTKLLRKKKKKSNSEKKKKKNDPFFVRWAITLSLCCQGSSCGQF